MRIIRTVNEMIRERDKLTGSIGFVPTMGYLHEGHLSLMRRARKSTDMVIASIFVNPTQFGPGEDLDRYPRDFARDEKLARETGVDLMFYPETGDMYPPGYASYVSPEGLDRHLCGAKRPGHFRGVMTVVLKLFTIVRPTDAYFGQKDIQQARILEQMVRDFHLPVSMHIAPIVREADGLAMSSRNVYLDDEQRGQAACLNQALKLAADAHTAGERSAARLIKIMQAHIDARPLARIDYISIVDDRTLTPVDTLEDNAIAALAVTFGSTRLIDNMLLR